MNRHIKDILWTAFAVAVLFATVFLVGVYQKSQLTPEQRAENAVEIEQKRLGEFRAWKETKHGIRYYTERVNTILFIITIDPSTGKEVISGVI